MLTREMIERSLPPSLKSAATQELTDLVNQATSDPIVAEQIRDNFITYSVVLQEGKYKTTDYVSAITYVTHKLMGLSNKDAYAKTFPQRMNDLIAKGVCEKDIAAYVSAYHRGKMVNSIMERAMIPTWLLNQEAYQEAINRQLYLMKHAASEMVQTQAANSLLTHLARPKEAAPAININLAETSGMAEMRGMLTQLASQQIELIKQGVTAKSVADQAIIDVEAKDATN